MNTMKTFTCTTTNYSLTYADILKAIKEEERKKHAFPVNFGKSSHWKDCI